MSDSIHSEEESSQEERWQTRTKSLKDGIGHIYRTKEFSDVLITVGLRTFKCHRLILGARSEEFAKMLLGKNTGTEPISIPGVSEDGFEVLLHFVYTDELPDVGGEEKLNVLLDAYRAAEKFKVEDLLKMAGKILSEKEINVDNICTILNETSDVEPLLQRCLNFIQNHAASVVESDNFLEATPKTLRTILETGYLKHVPGKFLLDRVVHWAGNKLTEKERKNYKLIRELLLPNNSRITQDYPLMSKLGIVNLTAQELSDASDEYQDLFTDAEMGKLLMHAQKPNANRPLPTWCKWS